LVLLHFLTVLWLLSGQIGLSSANAQTITGLTAADSAQLRVKVIRVLLDSIPSSWTESTRLWVSRPWRYDKGKKEVEELDFTAPEWSAIARQFPTAIKVGWRGEVFLCPPGKVVRMPGSSCPIQESGLILAVGKIQLEPDGNVQTSGQLVQTTRGHTWAEELGMRFVLDEAGGWRLAEILWKAMT
jgi:hypothetical protein